MYKKPIFYIVLGAILLVIGGITQLLIQDYYTSQEYYVKAVESNLEEELRDLEYEMIPILDSVSSEGILTFNDILKDTRYPYFVYRNGELQFWSTFHFTPEYDLIRGDYSIKVIAKKNSLYLIRKWFTKSSSGDSEVISILPLFVDFDVQNRYLEDRANNHIFGNQEVILRSAPQDEDIVVKLRKLQAFWLAKDDNFTITSSPINLFLLLIYGFSIVSLFSGVIWWSVKKSEDIGKWFVFLIIFTAWMLLKLVMAIFNFPGSLLSIELFDSRFFIVSWFEQSFGDMLLNTIMIFILSVVAFRHFRTVKINPFNSSLKRIIYSSAITFVLNLIINYQYLQLRTIYFNSQISLDIIKSLDFNSFRIISLIIFILVSGTTALIFHLFFKRIDNQGEKNWEKGVAIVIGTIFFWLFTLYANIPAANLILVTIIVSCILLISKIHRSIQRKSESLTLYIMFWVIVEAAVGGWCIANFEDTHDTNKMIRYAQNLESKNDFMAEFMINELGEAIKEDPSISARLSNPFLSKDYIIKKIKRGYIGRYLDKYNIDIYLYSYSGEGIPGFGTTLNYFEIQNRYNLPGNKTEYEGLYILSQDLRGLTKHYMSFIPIKRYSNVIGHIMIDLRQKRMVPQNVYPELLVDYRFNSYQNEEYSYAIFEEGTLIQNSGKLDYTFFNVEGLEDESLWVEGGYKHYFLQDKGEDAIVVSRSYFFLNQVVSNSTFLLTTLLIPILLILASYSFYQIYRRRPIPYTTKIQIFLNLAFFVPLVLVTITTLSFITTSFRQEQVDNKVEESARLATQIVQETDAYLVDVSALDLLTDKLKQLAGYGHFDATVFGTNGQMITTTQPDIFTRGLQSPYLNSNVFIKLIENSELSTVENESIGILDYYATYAAIRSPETNRLLGVLVIPFFGAESSIESNQIEALTTILNLFVLIFLLALVATFQTSRWLSAPLLLIRSRMEQTSFANENIPIEWDSDDEIGKLISEYNNMLVKLEASKEALSRSQKESAWREVAQQVAHEIKNPLTPMKLTLQKLERVVHQENSDEASDMVRIVKNLIKQLQILNDIVTSFSEFAKMPIPKNERMDLTEVLNEIKIHFAGDDVIDLKLVLHAEKVFIKADHKLINRILSNIVLNAGQSKKDNQTNVNVEISTEQIKDQASIQIKVKDNGSGIPPDIVERVFIPRFSTKKEGSGIGLAVAKHGIEHAGGTIWFDTEWGKGTTFYLQLPEIE